MIAGKMRRVVIGSSKVKKVEKENWFVVPNTHETIISQQLFDSVKKRRSSCCANHEKSEVSMLRMLRCGCCHHNLSRYDKDTNNVKYYCEYKKYTSENDCIAQIVNEVDIVKVLRKTLNS